MAEPAVLKWSEGKQIVKVIAVQDRMVSVVLA